MKKLRTVLLLALATAALAARRQLREDNVTGECPSRLQGCLHTRQ